MKRFTLVASILTVGVLLSWGCQKAFPPGHAATPATAPADDPRPAPTPEPTPEERSAKLGRDLKAAEQARDALAARLSASEQQLKAEQVRAADLGRERDQLQTALKQRTGEKEQLAAQVEGIRKSLRDVLGLAECAGLTLPAGVTGGTAFGVAGGVEPGR